MTQAAAARPIGTVTFLLSDLEGSTRLWEEHPAIADASIERQRELLHRAIARHGGALAVEQGEGDSVIGAFPRADDAVAAALEGQRELDAESWPQGVKLKVRMALHTGDGELGAGDRYVGPTLHRCARMRALAAGGQVLASQATRDLAIDHMPVGSELTDLGSHRLRDLDRPERIFELRHPDLPRTPGPLPSRPADALPAAATAFIGREREIEETLELLGGTRILTLIGVGGAGKSRLVLEAARRAAPGYPDGVSFVDLTHATEPALVASVISSALGVPVQPGRPQLDAVIDHLRDRRALVVLDNCEHVLDAVAEAARAMVVRCPDLRLLATSREPLAVAGETSWSVPPLSLPDDGEVSEEADAIRLFMERARSVRPDLEAKRRGLVTVASICRELDGLPLAIELAAARVRVLGLEQIAAGLTHRFQLLTGGPRGSPPRQQTLQASLDWSHDLLEDHERVLLRRLGAFAGGWTLEAAQAVCCDSSLPGQELLDLLTGLVDKSLVTVSDQGGAARYGMLETVRQYAQERLEESGDAGVVCDRHLAWCVALADDADRRLLALDPEGRSALEAESPNVRAGLAHAVTADPAAGLRIGAALSWYWRERGSYREGIAALDQVLAADAGADASARAHALAALLLLVVHSGDFMRAVQLAQEVIDAAEATGDSLPLAIGVLVQGFMICLVDPNAGRDAFDRSMARAGDVTHPILRVDVLSVRVITAHQVEDEEAVDRFVADALAVAEPLGHRETLAWCWWSLGQRALAQARPDAAREYAERILTASRDVHDPAIRGIAAALLATAGVMTGTGDQIREFIVAEEARYGAAGGYVSQYEMQACLAELDLAAGDFGAARATAGALLAPEVIWMQTVYQRWRAPWLVARAALAGGDAAAAREHADKVAEVAGALGNRRAVALALLIHARVALAEGDDERAEALTHEALSTFAEHGWVAGAIDALELLGAVAVRQGSADRAARLLACVAAVRAERGLVRVSPEPGFWDPAMAAAHAEAGKGAWEEGTALSLEDGVAYVRRGHGPRDRPLRGWGSLTDTEMQVARLVADGLNNPEIAARLFMSRSTVKAHLSHVYAKLDVAGRTELAALVAARGSLSESHA